MLCKESAAVSAAGFPGALLHTLLVSLDHFLDHLAADGASFTGGQVTVVTVGQVDAHFLSSLHLELLHSLLCLGNIDLIVTIAHIYSLLFQTSAFFDGFIRRNTSIAKFAAKYKCFFTAITTDFGNVNWNKTQLAGQNTRGQKNVLQL